MIEITHIGSQKYIEDKVILPLGQVYAMKIYMSSENQQLNTVEVKISKGSGKNLTKTSASKNISRNDIDNYSSLNRSNKYASVSVGLRYKNDWASLTTSANDAI